MREQKDLKILHNTKVSIWAQKQYRQFDFLSFLVDQTSACPKVEVYLRNLGHNGQDWCCHISSNILFWYFRLCQ